MLRSRFLWGGILAACSLLLPTPADAQNKPANPLAGTYRCDSIRVEGKKQRCTSPPLILNSDGSYQLWNEQGTYMVLDKYVVLSESRKRGPGLLKKGREIVFEYFHQNRKYTVNFRRVDKPPVGSAFS